MRVTAGFTLIELLVVITIIGLIASTVLSSLQSARALGRDASRISQLTELKKALELYRTANNTYPNWQGADTRANSCFSGGGLGDGVAQWSQALSVLVTGRYLAVLPRDPLNVSGLYDYCYGYHRQISNSPWDSCINKVTGEVYLPSNYEYLLYFSVENTNNWDITLRWNDFPGRFNACMLGPNR